MKDEQHWRNRCWQLYFNKEVAFPDTKSPWARLVEEIQADALGEPQPQPPINSPISVTNVEDARILLQVIGTGANQIAWHKSLTAACKHAVYVSKTLSGYSQKDISIIITRPRANIHI